MFLPPYLKSVLSDSPCFHVFPWLFLSPECPHCFNSEVLTGPIVLFLTAYLE